MVVKHGFCFDVGEEQEQSFKSQTALENGTKYDFGLYFEVTYRLLIKPSNQQFQIITGIIIFNKLMKKY